MKALKKATFLCVCLFSSVATQAQDVMTGAELFESFGVDFATSEILTETVAPGIHVLFGVGGNVAVSIGDQGVLLIDDQFPAMVPRIKAAIGALGGGDIDFVINTHWHFDHADGNPIFGEGGSWIVAQSSSRRMMTGRHLVNLVNAVVEQPPSPAEALPVITYEDRMQFHFNGDRVDLLHFGSAHTTGDTDVIFRGGNVVHMGDVFTSGGYPFIDVGNGGSLDGVILFCEEILKEINQDTVIIPGHGPVTDYSRLVDYVSMLTTIRERIANLIDSGATLEEVIAAKPTAQWDEEWGDPTRLLDRAYTSLSR
jgi:cyclase